MRSAKFAAAAMLLAASLSVAPDTYAQSELEQLDAQLPGALVNDPSRIDWESYGDLEASAIVDDSIPGGGAARRFKIKSASEQIYTAGTKIPLTRKVKRGDDITIGFYARTIEANSGDGKGVLRVRFQRDVEPFPGFGEKTLSIGNEWDWYEVTAEAESGLRTKDGIVVLQFGRTKQVLEIGQAIVVSGATAIADGATPVASQSIASPIVELDLPPPLVGLGKLINQPENRSWGLGGSSGSWTAREESQIWLGQATRFAANAGGSPSELFATIPISTALAEGDELLIAVAARTESAATDDGRAIVGIRVQDSASPDQFFANNRFKVGPNWQLVRIRTRATQAMAAGNAEVALHFASGEQQVDIGPVYVLKTN